MIQKFGNMWDAYDDADLFLITTNSFVTQRGTLVMGRGIAQQTRDRFPGIDRAFAKQITKRNAHLKMYGLLIPDDWPEHKIGCFQVKTHWGRPARLKLIRLSTYDLWHWTKEHPDASVHLNFPGIGYGQLYYEDVLPVVQFLPDSVTVWRFGYEEVARPD